MFSTLLEFLVCLECLNVYVGNHLKWQRLELSGEKRQKNYILSLKCLFFLQKKFTFSSDTQGCDITFAILNFTSNAQLITFDFIKIIYKKNSDLQYF